MAVLVWLCVLVVLISAPDLVICNCPVHGCSPSCSFSSAAQFVTASYEPKELWSWVSADGLHIVPSGSGCVTSAARVVCPLIGDKRSVLVSWDTVDDGKTHWNATLGRSASLPVMDNSGGYIASDGSKLVGYQCDGTPLGKAIPLFPINGQLFDLLLIKEKVVLFYKCGFLVVYLSNGIPHASVWMNDTVNGIKGTFIPLNQPAVQGDHMYVLTGFKPWESFSPKFVLLRLFAISVQDTQTERIKVKWFHDIEFLSDLFLPYIDSSETVCTTRDPPASSDDSSWTVKNDSDGNKPIIADIVVQKNTVLVVFNYYTHNHKRLKSKLLVVQDLVTNYSVNYIKEFDYHFQSVAVDSSTPTYDVMETKVWISFYDSRINQSVLIPLKIATGQVLSQVNVSNVLGVTNARVTSKMTFLHHQQTATNANGANPLVFGVLIEEAQSFVVSLDTKNGQVLWSLDQGRELCVGQISTVDRAEDSLLVVTTTVGVRVYTLTRE